MTIRRNGARSAIAVMLLVLSVSLGCAHRRDAYYARDTGPGVSVRAPFVNVQVQGKPKSGKVQSASRDRDDDDDDDDDNHKFSRLPVDRED